MRILRFDLDVGGAISVALCVQRGRQHVAFYAHIVASHNEFLVRKNIAR